MKHFLIILCFLAPAILLGQSKILSPDQLKETQTYTSVEYALTKKDSAFILDLSSQSMATVSPGVGALHRMQVLNLSNTNIASLPDEIGSLHNLQHLNLQHLESPNPNLSELPKTIRQLKNLENVNLIGNPKLNWERTVDLLAHLPKLKILALMKNELKTLPAHFSKLQTLEQAWLGGNLNLNPQEVIAELSKIKTLQHLGFGGCAFSEITFQPGQLENVHNMWLAGNKLIKLEGLQYLKKLKSLSLGKNDLKTLPKGLIESATLEQLALNKNPALDFVEVINELQQMKSLRMLDFSNNRLSKIPANVSKLSHLTLLVFRNNELLEEEKLKLKKYLPNTQVIYE